MNPVRCTFAHAALLIFLVAGLAGVGWAEADAPAGAGGGDAKPDPAEILRAVRLTQFQDGTRLTGRVRSGARTAPFVLTAGNRLVEYRFEKPPLTLQLTLGDDRAALREVSGGTARVVTPARFDQAVADTDITFEDLSLRFLYWSNASIEGEEIIGPRKTWRIQVHSPDKGSQYQAVHVWVDQLSGALMQMEGYNWSGIVVKRFRVVSGQTIGGVWTLKQMRIETFVPGTKKVVSRTYLEIDGE